MGKKPKAESAQPLMPDGATLDELRARAAGCRACDLWDPETRHRELARFVADLAKVAAALEEGG